MRFKKMPIPEGYVVRDEIAVRGDKSIYLLTNEKEHLLVLKVFKRTYKYPLYENLSRLTHINMPHIYGTFLMEDCFYVVEEYIEGRTLQEILDTDGALGLKCTVNIILQLCDVLIYLHNQFSPIIHRDITSSNVMLTKEGVVKLLDFDISRVYKEEAEKDTEIFGTKPFAPPEQYGFAQSDHRTDIYSLGVLITVMLTNTYDPKRIKNLRIKTVVNRCTAFDPKRRYDDVKKLKNMVKLCVPPCELWQSLMNMDTNIYVFPNTRLKIGPMLIPIIALYFSIIVLSFIQPFPRNGTTPKVSFLLFTVTINPQWTANGTQYNIFYIIIYTVLFTFAAFLSFAVYDILRFYYLKALQRYHLKRDSLKRFGVIPFVIASKRYVHCTLVLINVIGIVCSIPFTDIWSEYDIHGFTILVVLICNVVSFMVRGSRYPKYYNKAVRCYYKGDVQKAVKYAGKSLKCKRNHATAWLTTILKSEEEKKYCKNSADSIGQILIYNV